MGMDKRVRVPRHATLSWEQISALLAEHNYPVQMRMIDGSLVFPDAVPPENWRELRLGTPAGMITIRREEETLVLVAWGNADPELQRAWNALTWACVSALRSRVLEETGDITGEEFARAHEFPPGFFQNGS